MKIIDEHSLLSQQQLDLLKQSAAIPFSLGAFGSIDDMLTTLKVDVIIEPGIITRSIPSELKEAEDYWNAQKSQADDDKEIGHNLWIIHQNIEAWQKMPLRGLYDPEKNQIKLFPEEMQQEYGGQKMDELLVSTLVHETMHAYFNRPLHKRYPYVIFVEEPLAEYGMLLYLHETKSNYYIWAYDDVCSKNTCYMYGAEMMDQYLSGDTALREYLESYKILIDIYAIPSVRSTTIVLPKHGVPSSITLEGKKVSPKWCKLLYFYDKQTKTLGIDGDWRGIHLCHFPMAKRLSHDEPENIYISEGCQCDDFDTFSRTNVIVSPNNKTFKQGKMGVALLRKDNAPCLSSCGDGLYRICRNGKWGVVDNQLQVIVPLKYGCVWSWDENELIRVRVFDFNSKPPYQDGLVNKQGQEQVPLIYEDITRNSDGTYKVKKFGQEYTIDKYGKRIN